jgi:CubicO group peptidase (beta-lactamase class C family)
MRLALVVALGALTLACSPAPPLPPREPAPALASRLPPPDQVGHIAAVEHGLLPPVRVRGREQRRDLIERMRAYHVPGLSIAVIGDHRVLWSRAYGVADVETGQPMRETTLLQAGSISKPLTALAALEAVEQGLLGLDTPINDHLQGWKIPDSPFTEKATVSLRRLLSHTGGTTVHGFRGYRAEDPLPSLVQILDGKPPANTPPVRVDRKPGERYRYSGGGLTIVQLALVERFQRPFPALLHDLVLAPLGMERSSFEQPLPPALLADAAAGHDKEGKLIPGKRMIYPEMAAAGLWTTPADLGRFFAEIELGVEGKSKQIPKKIADLMTTPVTGAGGQEAAGLGLFLHSEGHTVYFGHTGINAGFHSMATMGLGEGYGAVMMANGELGMLLFEEIKRAIAVEYGWEGVAPPIDPVALSDEKLTALSGRFATGLIRPFVLSPKKGSLILERPFEPPVELVPIADDSFVALDDGARCHVVPAEVECVGKSGREKATRLAEGARPPLMAIAAGDHDGALAALRALQQADPQSPAVSEERLDTLGSDLFFRRDDRAHGLLVLRLAVELRPDAIHAYATLARAYEALGDKPRAIEIYRAGLAALGRDKAMPEERRKQITQAAERQIESLKGP